MLKVRPQGSSAERFGIQLSRFYGEKLDSVRMELLIGEREERNNLLRSLQVFILVLGYFWVSMAHIVLLLFIIVVIFKFVCFSTRLDFCELVTSAFDAHLLHLSRLLENIIYQGVFSKLFFCIVSVWFIFCRWFEFCDHLSQSGWICSSRKARHRQD